MLAALAALAALSVGLLPPTANATTPAPTGADVSRPAEDSYYRLRTGGARLVMAPAFMQELSASGATMSAIAPATLAVDPTTGITTVTFMVSKPRQAAVVLEPAGGGTVYFFTKGGLRFSGNGTSLDLTNILFAFDTAIGIDMTPNGLDPVDGYAVGPLMKMPMQAIRNAVAFTSPRFRVQEPLAELLRGEVAPGLGRGDGPVPWMTLRHIPLGYAQVAITVSRIS
jgi:hypothetical protein